ncbi:hypothetical protein RhiirA5_434500 [Rhizophagus irregularis]|uniref:Reverse transcriptase domain-containing protein n=1 Tax=Rhizophagus irregularis TaxID=588596 RepID=A0A2N0NQ12_9GLOM|nr:hypothetical protein RhiirA5_434500 [Rhizophagus irregularis]
MQKSIIFPGKAYIDDTTLLAKDQYQLETMLNIANEFYNLNDIKINKDKFELLLKKIDKSFNYSNSLMIRFESEYINIKPKNPTKSEVKKLIENIKHKRITDKQLQYVFNALIIPTIEYHAQQMSTATINHNLIYNIKDIADNQLQAKGTNEMS